MANMESTLQQMQIQQAEMLNHLRQLGRRWDMDQETERTSADYEVLAACNPAALEAMQEAKKDDDN